MAMFTRKSSLLVACGSLFWSTTALAVPEFPGELQEELAMPCAPPCTVCHDNPTGGEGTATKPFGAASIQNSAFGRDGLPGAIAQMREGSEEEQEFISRLEQGLDPNTDADLSICGPTYGCGARVEPRGELTRLDGFAGLAALAFGFVLFRTRRRAQ